MSDNERSEAAFQKLLGEMPGTVMLLGNLGLDDAYIHLMLRTAFNAGEVNGMKLAKSKLEQEQ